MSYFISENQFEESMNYALLRGDMNSIWDVTKSDKNVNVTLDPDILQREKERALRAQLNSTDGNTAEIHDQFYRDHKLLLVLFRLLAVMPIVRSSPGKVTFSWKSGAAIYAVVFYAIASIIVLIVGYERIKILQTTREFDEKIYAIIFVIFLVPHFWIPFVGWGVATHVAIYKTMWGSFQVRYYRVTGTSLQFPKLKILIVVIFIGCLLCAIIFLWTLSVLLDGFALWHTTAYYHIIIMINMNCALFYINCRGIKEASRNLSHNFRKFEESMNYALLRGDMNSIWDVTKSDKNVNATLDPDILQREKERALRAQLNSTDGNTAETHDQFYRDHKLVLVLFRLLAVMPILRSSPGKVTFSWKSWASIYAVCFYAVSSIIVLIVGYERVKILQTTSEFDEKIYAIIFVIFLVPHFWIPFVGWGVATHVAVYKTMWGTFQVRYYRVTGTSLQFPKLKILIVIIAVSCLLCAVLFLLALCALLDGFALWHTTAYYHIITMINMNCALWYINCRGIKEASRSLSHRFRQDVKVQCTAALLSQYRFLWLNLSELLQTLGNAYARTYSTYSLFMFINITIAVYGGLSEIIDHGLNFSLKEIGLFVDALYCSVLLFIFCDCSHKSTLEVAQGVQDTLLSINLASVDQQTKREVDLFIQAIEMNPAIVSLKGYANVNRELLTSSITTIAIYLIVLLQFKLSLVAQKGPPPPNA